MSNIEIKKIAIADDARVRIVMVEHRGEDEFDSRCHAFQRFSSPLIEVDYFDAETNEFQLCVDATLNVPGYVDEEYPDYYASLDKYVDVMSDFVEMAIEAYAHFDIVDYKVSVEDYDTKFELEYAVKRLRERGEDLRDFYNPQKRYDKKVKELQDIANGFKVKQAQEQLANAKAQHGERYVMPGLGVEQVIDNTRWIKTLEEYLPDAIEEQAEAAKKLKTISIREFEDKFAQKMSNWQQELDQAIAELEAA